MKNVVVMVVCCLLAWAASVQAAPALFLRDNRPVVENKGKVVPLSDADVSLGPVKDATGKPFAGLRYCAVGTDAAKTHGLVPGLYLFNAAGRMTAFVSTKEAEFCGEVRFSPGKKILAMDSGTWLVRTWLFFSYPTLKPLGDVAYYQAESKPALLWEGDSGVLFSSLKTEGHKRSCGYDPCGPVSVRAYSFKTGKATTLLAGTDRCDFTLTGFSPEKGTAAVDKLCLASGKAWKDYPEHAPVERVTVPTAAPVQ